MSPPLDGIDTIVFVMMENRSFDHMLGYLSLGPNGRTDIEGLKDDSAWMARYANPSPYESKSYGPARLPHPDQQLIVDPAHDRARVAVQLGTGAPGNYPMTGFVQATADLDPETKSPVVMGYWGADDVTTNDFLAQQFAVCDHWFSAFPTCTQPNRLMSLAGTSLIGDSATVLAPQDLVYDWLDKKNISWRVYHDGLPFASSMPNWWGDVVLGKGFSPYNQFRLDNKNLSDSDFPQVVFIEPRYTNAPHSQPPEDDHAPSGITSGQQFILKVYSDLVANPERWSKSLLIITYDEHGGFFDHVSPLPTNPTAGGPYDPFLSTGVRVPAFLISPWIAPGSVFSEPVDHLAFLQLLARKFGGGSYSSDVDNRRINGAPMGDLTHAVTLATSRPDIAFPGHLTTGYTLKNGPMDDVSVTMKNALQKMKKRYPGKTRKRFPELMRFS